MLFDTISTVTLGASVGHSVSHRSDSRPAEFHGHLGAPDGRTEDGSAGSVATLTPKHSATPVLLTGGELPQAEAVAHHLVACRGEVARSVPGNKGQLGRNAPPARISHLGGHAQTFGHRP